MTEHARDAVVVMPGWEASQGARLEVHVARECGIPVVELDALINNPYRGEL